VPRTLAATLVTVAAALALSAPSASAPAAPAETHPAAAQRAYVAPPIGWGSCDDLYLRAIHAQCGDLVVPLDDADPTGPTIRLAVSRVLHTGDRFRGVRFTNPGGPGASGLWMAGLGNAVPDGVGSTYDWYGLDTRGVGASRPRLTCEGRYFSWDRPPYVPTSAGILARWRDRTEDYAAACGHAGAARLLPHLRTADTVADLEVLREAIGAEKVGFYGGSYGTYLGQVYATEHPDRVKRLVMDGVVDPTRVFYAANLDQDRAFQKVFGRFFSWVAERQGRYHLGGTRASVSDAYTAELARLRRHPAGGGDVGPAELTDAMIPAGYSVSSWPTVARALSRLVGAGDASGVKQLYRGGNPSGPGADNSYAVYLATECTDAPWPARWSRWKRDNTRIHRKAPVMTWANAWYNAPCRTWPADAGPRVHVTGSALTTKVLLVSETYDAATPLSGALRVRSLFPTASLVEGVGGSTHAAGLSGVGCVDRTIARYLATGAVPKRLSGNRSDKRCAAVRAPGRGSSRAQARQVRSQIVCGSAWRSASAASESASATSVTTYPCWPRVARY
jgi:pimeloyl-ACP methyl ester carboxylesterase